MRERAKGIEPSLQFWFDFAAFLSSGGIFSLDNLTRLVGRWMGGA